MTEMLQKTENVAKNVANENSQDLTEQWKKGKLPEGHYYIKTHSETNIDEYIQWYKDHGIPSEKSFAYFNVQQVLAPVPIYDEYQQLKEYERIVTSYNMKPIDYDIACETVNKLLDDNKRLKHDVGNLGYKIKNQRHEIDNRLKEVEKLKELLKEVKDYLPEFETPMDILAKIDEALK